MQIAAPFFPERVWNGLCYQYSSLDIDKSPDFFWRDQAVQEIIAIEKYLFDSFGIENEFAESAFEGDIIASYGSIFLLGNSDVHSRSHIIGLADSFIPAGSQGQIQSIGIKTLDNWYRITGAEFLESGKIYFLASDYGKMTTVIPTTGWLVKIGIALTETKFFINIKESIRL